MEQVVAQLKARDREVRSHEMAHVAAGGQYVTSGPTYTYQTGPDGQRYAIGGSVGIDTSPVSGDPEATIQKAQQVIAAAMAPAQPSNTDRQVASQASQMAMQARAELAAERAGSRNEGGDGDMQEREAGSNDDPVSIEPEPTEAGSGAAVASTANEARNAFELRMMDQRLALPG
ncbi:hypothetical protein AVO41_04440 [Thiomicrospira sp. WB1]|nr:hypothetical protein AVO41_04440 [Thiomicrospira sp. WB1]